MRIVTKLVKTEFVIDRLYVDEDGLLVMENAEDEKMRVRAYMDSADIVSTIKSGLNVDVIKFIVGAPLAARRARKTT